METIRILLDSLKIVEISFDDSVLDHVSESVDTAIASGAVWYPLGDNCQATVCGHELSTINMSKVIGQVA